MRRLRILLFSFLVLLLLLGTAKASGEETWYFRVIGRDDTAAGQEEKLRVRDAVLGACPQEAGELPRSLDKIRAAAEVIAPCAVSFRLWSPDKKTPRQPTLYVTVGEGRGHNCWGVLYQDSLLMAQVSDMPEEDQSVRFVWPVWEWFLRLLGL